MLGEPKHEGKDEENLTHFFRHYLKIQNSDKKALWGFIKIISVKSFANGFSLKGDDYLRLYYYRLK